MAKPSSPFQALKLLVISLAALATTQYALAQETPIGEMDYGPAALPVAVPIGGGLFLIVLAGLLAFLAGRGFLRRSAFAPMALLSVISLALGLSGAQLVERGWAALAAVQLDNPAGDTVDIFPGYREYQNATGGPLAIQRIEIAECTVAGHVATASLHPSCTAGTILGSGETCQTDYPACACGNPNGGGLTRDNGTGTGDLYCHEAEDSLDTLARKACESHFGEGECCVITGGYSELQWGQCGMGGGEGTIHWHPDSHPTGHCGPIYVEGDVVSPGWCGTVLGNFLPAG